MEHDWVESTLGHGEQMCSRCKITNREAATLGLLNMCDAKPTPDVEAKEATPESRVIQKLKTVQYKISDGTIYDDKVLAESQERRQILLEYQKAYGSGDKHSADSVINMVARYWHRIEADIRSIKIED